MDSAQALFAHSICHFSLEPGINCVPLRGLNAAVQKVVFTTWEHITHCCGLCYV